MAKGSESKSIFYEKILEMFEGSFIYNDGKEIRIPFNEDGKDIQLKIVVTCAKNNVEPDEGMVVPEIKTTIAEGTESVSEEESIIREPSTEELDTVNNLMISLGL